MSPCHVDLKISTIGSTSVPVSRQVEISSNTLHALTAKYMGCKESFQFTVV